MSYPPPQPGYGGGYGAPAGPPPDSGQTKAIIATIVGFLFCCPALITGILAIVNANKVQGLWNSGDQAGARKAAEDANRFTMITFVLAGIGVVINIVYFVFVLGSSST